MFELEKKYVYGIHLLLVGPLLAYIAYTSLNGVKLSDNYYNALYVVAAVVAFYHGKKLYEIRDTL